MIKGLIFDLDGTLLDTIDDIALSLNAALRELGLELHSLEECKLLVGSGINDLAEVVLPPSMRDPASIEGFVARFREHYARNWRLSTCPYPGIPQLLATLAERELRLAILSNKSQRFTALMAEHWFQRDGKPLFDPVWGVREGVPIKPDPAAALEIAALWGVPPGDIAFVGDSEIDMQTARTAGMLPVGVAWGFRPASLLWDNGARAVLSTPEELLPQLQT